LEFAVDRPLDGWPVLEEEEEDVEGNRLLEFPDDGILEK